MIGFEASGPPPESTTEAELESQAARITKATNHFGTGDFLHYIVHRVAATTYPERTFPSTAARLIDDERREQFRNARYYVSKPRAYISNQDEGTIVNRVKATFFGSTAHRIGESRELQYKRFIQRVRHWEDSVSSVLRPKRMTTRGMFRDLVLCVTGRDYPAIEPSGRTPLHHAISQQDLIGGSEPEVGDLVLRPVSVTLYPGATVPQMLGVILKDPGQLMLSVRYVCLDQIDALAQLQLERNHWVRESQGGLGDIIAKILNMPRRKSWNEDAEKTIADVDEAIAACNGGMPFGFCNVTAIVIGEDAEIVYSRCRQIIKDLGPLGLTARIEDANASPAVLGAWPGEGTWNRRRPLMPASAVSEMILPVEYWQGTPTIDSDFFEAGTPAPLIVSGSGHSPFAVPSHHKGVGNGLILGGTGGGKSTIINADVAAITALPHSKIVWIDYRLSSYVLTKALGGVHIELATDGSSALCPFQFLDTPNGRTFLFEFFSRLFKRWGFELDERQAADLTEALTIAQYIGIRTMTPFIHLIHDRRMRGVLANYGNGGQWAHIFDGEPVNHDNQLVTYEMQEIDPLGERVSAPATELIMYGVEAALDGKHPHYLFADEAWRLLDDPISHCWLYGALRMWRKRQGSIVLATQNIVELSQSGYLGLLLESCPIKIFTPTSELKSEYVREAYRKLNLSELELDNLSEAVSQKQYYLTYPDRKRRMFDLDLGPIGRALCASTATKHADAARELLARVGESGFLNEWLNLRLLPANGVTNGNATRRSITAA
jgi:type IV secretory pathway VirB4 component